MHVNNLFLLNFSIAFGLLLLKNDNSLLQPPWLYFTDISEVQRFERAMKQLELCDEKLSSLLKTTSDSIQTGTHNLTVLSMLYRTLF